MVHYAGYTPRFHPSDFHTHTPRRGRRRLADRLRRAPPALRDGRARTAGRRPGLAVGAPAPVPVLPAPGLRGGLGHLAGRDRPGHRDARRPGRHRQRHLRQPSALHLPRLLPAGLQGQRQSQPVRHPPSRRPGPRGGDPGRMHGGTGRDRRRRPGHRRDLHPRRRARRTHAAGPASWPWPATPSRRPGSCSTPPHPASRTGWATTTTRSAGT